MDLYAHMPSMACCRLEPTALSFLADHRRTIDVTSVSTAGHEHHERIDTMLDGLPVLADMLDERPRPARFEDRYRTPSTRP